MNKILPIASLALIVGGLNAQGSSMTVQKGGIVVSAQATGSTTAKTATLAEGAVTHGAYARVSDGKSRWRPEASASKSVRHAMSKYSGRLTASVSDYASAAMGTGNSAGVAQGSVAVQFKTVKKGKLIFSYYGRGNASISVTVPGMTNPWTPAANGNRYTTSVDVAANATTDFSVASKADASGTAKAGAYATNSFSAMFVPEVVSTTCTVVNSKVVTGCPTFTLAGTVNPKMAYNRHVIDLAVQGNKSSWYLNLMAGADKGISMANKCMILDKAMWAGFGRTDAMGAGKSRFYLRSNKAMSAAMQSAFFSFGKTFTLETTNGIVITCK